MDHFQIRNANEGDIPVILQFIKELAEYERMSDQVAATEESLKEWIFEKQQAEVLIGEMGGKPVGFALFFHNFSTFLGRSGIYLEDLYIQPHARGNGLGKLFFSQLAKLCLERNCGRLEWSCLDWNQNSIHFYLSMGAEPMSDWTVYRMTGNTLERLAKK